MDGFREWLVQFDMLCFVVVESECNFGFCGGYNQFIEESLVDVVVLFNNDMWLKLDWFVEFVGVLCFVFEDVVVVFGFIVDWEGECFDFVWGVMIFDGYVFQLDYYCFFDQVMFFVDGEELFFVCGGNMFICCQSFFDVGGFDLCYFVYFEDVDFGW